MDYAAEYGLCRTARTALEGRSYLREGGGAKTDFTPALQHDASRQTQQRDPSAPRTRTANSQTESQPHIPRDPADVR